MVDTESHARAIVGSTSQPIRDALLPDDTVCVGLFLSLQVDRVAPAGERWRTIIGRVLSAAATSAIIRNRPRTRSDRRNWKPAVIITLGESFILGEGCRWHGNPQLAALRPVARTGPTSAAKAI